MIYRENRGKFVGVVLAIAAFLAMVVALAVKLAG